MEIDPAHVEAIFGQAVALSDSATRAAYLEQTCGSNTQLRDRVESLLVSHQATANFLNLPPSDSARSNPPLAEGPGTKLGRYKLLQQIGEGGFGVVFMAEQEHPVRRRVALKIIKLGMDTREVVARFEAERQALAMMEHPNIAKVLDAGATETGRPFFVMELVKGVPITLYCDKLKLSITKRLELFAQVCLAIQHAHQKGLIHRDIKPSNVLVNTQDDRPVAKVIDFGIAKATQARLTEKTLFTEFQQLIGTPQYMSPEQAEGSLDVDTRSDVYSLGVLLYELLTATTPFDGKELRSKAFAEMQRIIREVEPPTPSIRLSTMVQTLPDVAAHRAVEPRKLDALVRGELDWIVMKCLEKDRTRRYETANDLAMDLQRYLDDEAVIACPPSATYKLRKFARRHRTVLATAAVFVLVLLLAATISTSQAIRATRAQRNAVIERDRAEQSRQQAEEVAAYLTNAFSSPAQWRDGRTITIAEVLDRDVRELQDKFNDNPQTKATLLLTIGDSYVSLGLNPQAIPLLEKAVQLRQSTLGPQDPQTLAAMHRLAWGYDRAGRLDEAVALEQKTLDLTKTVLGPMHPDTLVAMENLALHYHAQNRPKEAIPILEQTLQLRTQVLGPDDEATIRTMGELAGVYGSAGMLDKAIPLNEQSLKFLTAKLGTGRNETIWSMLNLASAYREAGRVKEAVPLAEQAAKLMLAMDGPDHPDTLMAQHDLARDYRSAGRRDEAIALMEQILKPSKTKLGVDHPNTLWLMGDLADAYIEAGRGDEAISLMRETVELDKARLGPTHPDTLLSMHILAWDYYESKRYPEAIALQEEVVKQRKIVLGPNHPETLMAMRHLGFEYRDSGQIPQAIEQFDQIAKIQTSTLGANNPDTLDSIKRLDSLHQDLLRTEQVNQMQADLPAIRQAVAQQRWDDAVDRSGKLLDALSHDAPWNSPRKALCLELAASEELFNRLIAARPDDVDLWVGRGRHFEILRDWKQAIAQYDHVQANLPTNSETVEYACLFILSGNQAGYEQFVKHMQPQDVSVRTMVILLAPQSIVPADQFIPWAKDDTRFSGPRPPQMFLLALAYYRAGQFDDAINTGSRLNNPSWPEASRSLNWMVMALAHQRLGHSAEARGCLDTARKLLDPFDTPEKYDPDRIPLPDLLGAQVLLREAEALIPATRSSTQP